MKILSVIILAGFLFVSCKDKTEDAIDHNKQVISNRQEQDSLFREILSLTGDMIPGESIADSLSFLLLPVEAACPSCRNKTIDSIDKYKAALDNRHFIIVSGSGKGRIETYFLDRKHELPNERNILIDTTNEAFVHELVFSKPVVYNAFNKKVYEKISCVPTTIKRDLKVYFSGLSNNNAIGMAE